MMTILLAAVAAAIAQPAPPAESRYRHMDNPPDPAAQLAEMVDLYDRICLRAFPDDKAAAAAMAALGATPLTPAQVRIFLHDDPGVGWHLAGRSAAFEITIEAPPYHACSVRTMTARGFPEMAPYRRLADGFQKGRGFAAIKPLEFEGEGVHSWMAGEKMDDEGGGSETLLVVTGIPTAEHRAHGEDSAEVRFVHQRVSPGAR